MNYKVSSDEIVEFYVEIKALLLARSGVRNN